MPPKKKISQETFDDAVKTNIEDFDMDADEAVRSAVEEFELQGYDITGIIKSASANVDDHVVIVCTNALKKAIDSNADEAAVQQAITSISNLFSASSSEELQQNLAMSVKAGTIAVLLDCITSVSAAPSIAAADALAKVVQTADTRAALQTADGAKRLVSVLRSEGCVVDLQASILQVAESACQKDEDAKCSFMDAGLGDLTLDLLQKPETSGAVVIAACGFLKSATNADDEDAKGSKAFMHARKLGKAKSMAVLVSLLKRFDHGAADVCCAVLAALHRLAANDDICKEFIDEGGLIACVGILKSGIRNKPLVMACCTALRQLTNSDSSKKSLVEGGYLELLISVLLEYTAVPDALEPAFGLVANLTLRNPGACEEAAQHGLIDVLIDTLSSSKDGPVVRQACLVTRNMVVRNPDLRPQFLAKGAEALLRQAKKAYPSLCNDVGYAALRDLGLDNYNE